jgi:hypothetical protein
VDDGERSRAGRHTSHVTRAATCFATQGGGCSHEASQGPTVSGGTPPHPTPPTVEAAALLACSVGITGGSVAGVRAGRGL